MGEAEFGSLEWALAYARTYWQRGNEPESQAALTVLAREVDRLSHTDCRRAPWCRSDDHWGDCPARPAPTQPSKGDNRG